jgi:hypothetical protein
MINWGGFFYVFPDKYELWVRRELGWCYTCNTIQPIEYLTDISKLIDVVPYLRKELAKLTGHGILRFVRRHFGKNKIEIELLQEEIVKAERFIALLKARQSPPKCLKCSGSEIAHFDIPEFYEKKEPQQIPFRHPGCNGQLWVEESGLRIAAQMKSRYYTLEGDFISEDDNQSPRSYYSKRPMDHPLDTIKRLYFG